MLLHQLPHVGQSVHINRNENNYAQAHNTYVHKGPLIAKAVRLF